jgi:poly(A) polymerase
LLRAGIQLRCESGELDAELGNWWATFYAGDIAERERLITTAREPAGGDKKKRPRRRGPRKTGDDGAAQLDAGAQQAASGPDDE